MTTEFDGLSARVAELEVRIAFQDDLLSALNAGQATADGTVRSLRGEMAKLREAIEAIRTALNPDVRDEPPPPHY